LEVDDCRTRTRVQLPDGLSQFEADVAEGRRRFGDWYGAWYHGGLAAGGLAVDWRGWYRARIAAWSGPGGGLRGPSSAAEELASLAAGRLDHLETLPAYWMLG
jgi:hypothetical protein